MSSAPTSTWLTQEAYDRLQAELDELIANRPFMASEINARREEGDLKENSGYHAAKDEQGKAEARIRYLQQLLRHAEVGVAPEFDGVAGPGTILTVRFAGEEEPETFLLGSPEEELKGLTVYSVASPLGQALKGRKGGEKVTYKLPNGRETSVELLTVEPYSP